MPHYHDYHPHGPRASVLQDSDSERAPLTPSLSVKGVTVTTVTSESHINHVQVPQSVLMTRSPSRPGARAAAVAVTIGRFGRYGKRSSSAFRSLASDSESESLLPASPLVVECPSGLVVS